MDGNENQNAGSGGVCAHTNNDVNPYWIIDLANDAYIGKEPFQTIAYFKTFKFLIMFNLNVIKL